LLAGWRERRRIRGQLVRHLEFVDQALDADSFPAGSGSRLDVFRSAIASAALSARWHQHRHMGQAARCEAASRSPAMIS